MFRKIVKKKFDESVKQIREEENKETPTEAVNSPRISCKTRHASQSTSKVSRTTSVVPVNVIEDDQPAKSNGLNNG